MKIALLADLHLPDSERSVKEEVLDWALATAKRLHADRIVGAGDLTATGSAVSAKRLRSKLIATGIPYLLTPGNAEMRSPVDRAKVAELLATPVEAEGIVLLDTSRSRLSEPARALLAKSSPAGVLAVTHCPPDIWPEEDRALLEKAFRSGRICKLIAGHWHIDGSFERLELVRGLDPDKASGGAPELVIFDGGERENIVLEDADPRSWPREEREAFCDRLGCSGMKEPVGVLKRGSEAGMKVFELRFTSPDRMDEPALLRALGEWRARGGVVLSLHLPDLSWRDGEIHGAAEFREAVRMALDLGCSHVTWHVPRVAIADFESACDALLDAAESPVRRLLAAGISIGIENLHIVPGESVDARNFGCTPDECREWIELLRWRLDCCSRIGFNFDLGHARNNGPLANLFTISDWYEELGDEINGFHLHQVVKRPDGTLCNHMPLVKPFGSLISLASLFLGWRRGTVNPAPMFLEIRDGDPVESMCRLRAALQP
ncbi:TIM barrel protein [uncultured Victivallis sp.]|uniref:TIM barrel protein n=1 Tax=uncultured Victivallis sp. TaxID=354118 RepID=UPI0025F9C99C|nr:TIM barrel protein [uncultured Victivallis sp.]